MSDFDLNAELQKHSTFTWEKRDCILRCPCGWSSWFGRSGFFYYGTEETVEEKALEHRLEAALAALPIKIVRDEPDEDSESA